VPPSQGSFLAEKARDFKSLYPGGREAESNRCTRIAEPAETLATFVTLASIQFP
jgi:hypothetical protein